MKITHPKTIVNWANIADGIFVPVMKCVKVKEFFLILLIFLNYYYIYLFISLFQERRLQKEDSRKKIEEFTEMSQETARAHPG